LSSLKHRSLQLGIEKESLRSEMEKLQERWDLQLYRVGHEKVARLPFARVLVIFSLWHLWYSLWR
jgi:hypothetical protein